MASANIYVPRRSPSCPLHLWEAFPRLSKWVLSRLYSNYYLCVSLRICKILHVPFKSGVSVSYRPLALLYTGPKDLQTRHSPSQCRTPSLGSLMWKSDPLHLAENLGKWLSYVSYPGVWVFTIPYFHPYSLSLCGSFFISLVVENIFC